MRPKVGFSVLIPQHCAGQRSDPPFVPEAQRSSCRPRARLRRRRWSRRGFGTGPMGSRSLPAVRCRCASASRGWPCWCGRSGSHPQPGAARRRGRPGPDTALASALAPNVVGVPTRSMSSLTVKGTPCNGGRSPPAATARSAAFAASSACSPRTTVTALTAGLTVLDPPQVRLDDLLTGHLPGPDRCGQVRGAHAPQVGGSDAHVVASSRSDMQAGRRECGQTPRFAAPVAAAGIVPVRLWSWPLSVRAGCRCNHFPPTGGWSLRACAGRRMVPMYGLIDVDVTKANQKRPRERRHHAGLHPRRPGPQRTGHCPDRATLLHQHPAHHQPVDQDAQHPQCGPAVQLRQHAPLRRQAIQDLGHSPPSRSMARSPSASIASQVHSCSPD